MKKFLLVLLTLLLLSGCSTSKEEKEYTSIEDFVGKKVAAELASVHEAHFEQLLPNSTKVVTSTSAESMAMLKTDKVDGIMVDEPVARMMVAVDNELDYAVIPNIVTDTGFIFSDDSDLVDEFNAYLAKAIESGYIKKLEEKWINNASSKNDLETKEYTPTKRKIMGVSTLDEAPYVYQKDDKAVGFSMEIFYDFCYQTGYDYEIQFGNFDGLLSAVQSGKYEIGIADITKTDERMKNMRFSNSIHSLPEVVVYKKQNKKVLEFNDPMDLNGKNIGCMSGSIFDITIKETFKDYNVSYFNSRSELIMGLEQGKIDGYLADEPVAMVCTSENESIGYIDESLGDTAYGICFSSKASLKREQFNKFLEELNESGELASLQEKWFKPDAINQKVEEIELTGENGVINCVTTPDAAPFSFFKDNEYQGYELELLTLFAKEYGYGIEIVSSSFDALLSAIASDKYDVAYNGIYITEEREKSVDFSNPVYKAKVVAVVRNLASKSNNNFISNIKDKLYRTFIEEERYKLIFDGILTTLKIAFYSILFGTITGFIYYLLSRKSLVIKKIGDFIAYVVSGMPAVVILMILFYIIFAKSKLSGDIISIIGFTLIFGCSVYGMLKTGVEAIDKGQFEGAYALGYTENTTLFKFIFPQALRIVMPTYQGEIISLIKSSSIVGYVTVQDITRVSDIIRSRTYDAFFPLIVTAIIYFILAYLLTKLAKYIQKKLLPNEKTKEEILESVGQKNKEE